MPNVFPDLSIVVAMSRNRVIGYQGDMPWKIPSDLARFKKITLESSVVVMGRKTHESILKQLGRPLSGRESIVLTRAGFDGTQVHLVPTFETACAQVRALGGRACVIGGGEIYKIFLPVTQTIHLTTVDAEDLPGDTFFPDIDRRNWTCVERLEPQKWDPRDQYATTYEVLQRKQ